MSQSKANAGESNGRFAYDGLERVFHEKARLGIMTSLVSQPRGVIFADLKEMCHLTDGNLSRHLQVLHEAGLVEIWKGYHKNRPQTLCRVTDEGRRRFLEYINVLETVVEDALTAAVATESRARNVLEQYRKLAGKRTLAFCSSQRRGAKGRHISCPPFLHSPLRLAATLPPSCPRDDGGRRLDFSRPALPPCLCSPRHWFWSREQQSPSRP